MVSNLPLKGWKNEIHIFLLCNSLGLYHPVYKGNYCRIKNKRDNSFPFTIFNLINKLEAKFLEKPFVLSSLVPA